MAVFKTKVCARFARKANVTDAMLRQAKREADAGLIDADLGGGLIKQRVARAGGGKSGGYRALLAYHEGQRTVFLDVFAKKDWDNIEDDELKDFKTIGKAWLKATAEQTEKALNDKILIEVKDEDDSDDADESEAGL